MEEAKQCSFFSLLEPNSSAIGNRRKLIERGPNAFGARRRKLFHAAITFATRTTSIPRRNTQNLSRDDVNRV